MASLRALECSVRHSLFVKCLGVAALSLGWLGVSIGTAREQPNPAAETAWQAAAIAHAQAMRRFRDADHGSQETPSEIPKLATFSDPTGVIATYQSGGPTQTANDPFFQTLGTNGRSCATCHQPENAWSVSAESVRARFAASGGSDPIFRLVDGATCPTADVSSLSAKQQAYRLLLEKGLIRIGLAMPSGAEFVVESVDDPYDCNTNPITGLTTDSTGIVSVYRRPLPATNLGFLSTIMWDGREPSLASQASDATLGHAQADNPPTPDQVQQIVDFESGLFTAQLFDDGAKDLDAAGATGGPKALSQQVSQFFVGVNDPFGQNPTGAAFDPNIFEVFDAWDRQIRQVGVGGTNDKREQIARGEEVFNSKAIDITGVAGINDALQKASVSGSCGTCHDTPNAGSHSVKAPLDIGVSDAGAAAPPALDISGLPVFTLRCVSGPLSGQSFIVTDPGRALISGKCADIGKIKGPVLRGLAARGPYFHNGSAKTLMDVVNFYDDRFNIGFSDQEKADLVAFLNAL